VRTVSVIDGLGFGGAERSLAELLPGLREAGIDTIVVCLRRREGGVEPDVISQGFDVRFLPPGKGARLRTLRALLRSIDPALVHTSLVEASLVGRFAAARTGVPVLSSLVSQSYTSARRSDPHVHRAAVAGVRSIDRWSARHLTTHLHAITHAVKDWAVEALRLPADRITVVERGRDPRRLGEPSPARRVAARERLQLPLDAEVLVAVGRQEYAKGHRFLVEAMETVTRTRPAATLLMAGRPGAETPHLRALAERLELGSSIRFLGYRDDLPDVLAASDVFVFPSLWEGLGGAVIEAMALGVPIVASDLPPVVEVVEQGRCALLVPPGSIAPLAQAIASVLEDPARARRLGEQGRDIFQRRFTLARSTQGMVELFRTVAASPRQAAATGIEVA
jgi:glycosyltransferase involved in cell wall biosynthesis